MGCKHKYRKIDLDGDYTDSNRTSLKKLSKAGNKSIDGLMHKCVAVKRKGCRK